MVAPPQFWKKNLTIQKDSVWNFLSKNICLYVLNLFSFQVTTKTYFHKPLQNCESGTIFKYVKSRTVLALHHDINESNQIKPFSFKRPVHAHRHSSYRAFLNSPAHKIYFIMCLLILYITNRYNLINVIICTHV